MMKYSIALLSLFILFNAYSEENSNVVNIGTSYIKSNFGITNYNVTVLPNINKYSTLLFTNSKINSQKYKEKEELFIEDGFILSILDGKVVQYLQFNRSGLLKTKETILYDFSRSNYNYINFIGWIFYAYSVELDDKKALSLSFQLAKNRKESISADPPLSCIFLYTKYDYPVIYDYTYYGLYIESSLNDDNIISMARGGLLAEKDLGEPSMAYENIQKLSPNEKRLLRNALFAVYGYQFKNLDLLKYFSKYWWYKPNSKIENSINILDENQRRLLEYLNTH